MSEHLHMFFASAPLAAVALALALGYWFGKIRLGTFVLGPVAATLLVAIAVPAITVAHATAGQLAQSNSQRLLGIAMMLVSQRGPVHRDQPRRWLI